MAGKTTKVEYLSHDPIAYLAEFSRFDGSIMQIWMRPMIACLRWQVDMVNATEPVAMDWFARQRVASRTALAMVEKLALCRDPSEAVSIQREWFEGAVKRMIVNFETLAEQAASLSREAVAATRDAAQSVPEVLPLAKQRAGQKEGQIDAAA
jgi:hypothetical protein